MSELDYSAEPLIVSLDICYLLERSIEELDDNVGADDGHYPSQLAPRTYEKIEEVLKKEGIDIDELNKKINKAMFGEEGCIRYYPYKEN